MRWCLRKLRSACSNCPSCSTRSATEAIALAGPSNRIHGYFMFMLNPTARDPIARATNALNKLGLHGICLCPAMHRYRAHDDRVQAVCELAAERKGVSVVVRVTSCAIHPSRAHARGLIPERKQKHLPRPKQFEFQRDRPMLN